MVHDRELKGVLTLNREEAIWLHDFGVISLTISRDAEIKQSTHKKRRAEMKTLHGDVRITHFVLYASRRGNSRRNVHFSSSCARLL